jgi:hypothetical protein
MAAFVPAHSDGFVPESHRVPYYPLQIHFGLRAPEGSTANLGLDVKEAPPSVNGFLLLVPFQKMVDFGPGQGRSDFETGGVAALRRGSQRSENGGRGRKMPFLNGH